MSFLVRLQNTKRRLVEEIRYRKHLSTLPRRISEMRSKERIKVLFVLWDLSMWKTEVLYLYMLNHSRFEPVIGLTLSLEDCPSEIISKFQKIKNYLLQKGHSFIELTRSNINEIAADIIFYEKPYDFGIDEILWYKKFSSTIICHNNYAFNSSNQYWAYGQPLHKYSTFYFLENNTIKDYVQRMLPYETLNFRVTGLPFMDELLKPKESYKNQWNDRSIDKKKIIWAPHYTIPGREYVINYSCFLDVYDFMLEIAEKYKNEIFIAFKPHPLLKSRLIDVWGEDRTDCYYRKWAECSNAQFEDGAYMGLFKYSDAMIHDCSSFTIEYLYTNNPVMYLVNGKPHMEGLNDFAKGAYNCHYFGHTHKEIEQFVKNVINGEDTMREQRQKYFEKNLLPPNGKSACENIVDAILGLNGYE